MVTLMIKGIYSVLAAYLLIATTSIEKICYALRLLHIPAILVTQVLLTYRYVTKCFSRRQTHDPGVQSARARSEGCSFQGIGNTGRPAASAQHGPLTNEVYESMTLRGYRGEFYYTAKEP